MTNFEAGKTYTARSVCDSDCIITVKVVSRTAKFMTTDKGKRLGISRSSDGIEQVRPWGSYSMCPIVRAVR